MKKSLSAIFCLVIMLSLSVPVSASAFDSSNYASSNSSAVAQSQYEMLMDSFGFDSSLSDIVYYYAIGTASGSKHSTNNLTEDTFIECYVSQMIYAIQPLDCSYLPLS